MCTMQNGYRVLTGIIFYIGTALTAWCAEPYYPQLINPLTQSWRWKHFPELEGKGARDIMEGPDKRVWVASNEGVFEYNGYEWKRHNAENGLDAAPVDQVYAATSDQIYATTPKGVYRYSGKHWSVLFPVPEGVQITFNQIRKLADGSIMVCSSQGVLHFSKKDRPDFYTSAARTETLKSRIQDVNWVRLPDQLRVGNTDFTEISDVLEDRNGVIWLAITMPGETGRLLKFRLPAVTTPVIADYELIGSDENTKLGETQRLLETQDGKIWVINTTYKTGIMVFQGANRQYIKLSDHCGGDEYATDIVQTADGTIWISTLGKLYTFKNNTWKFYAAPEFAIPANRLLLQKSTGNKIWVAGFKSKVFLLDFSTDHWASYAELNFQGETATGEQWFIDVHGKIIRRKGNTWTAFDTRDGLMDAPIRLIITSKGQIWAAGSHGGEAATAVLHTDRWERRVHSKLSWGIDYRAVFEAADGTLWFGGAVDRQADRGQLGGVLQLTNPTSANPTWKHHVYHENGLLQSNVYGIGQSKDGRIWIGGGSLYFYDGTSWQQPEDESLRQYVNVVYSTSKWLIAGSRYYGVFIFDGEKWTNYNTDHGLPSNTIISVDVVNDKYILVATENGICCFDGTSWVSNIFPPELNMDFEGGMLLHDSRGAVWINKSSRSWKRRAFTHSKTQNGLFRNFATYRYIPDQKPPETAISFFNAEVPPDGNAVIKWAGRDYYAQSDAQWLQYSWRLDGGPWSVFSHENHNTFMSLSSGRHVLEVRARDMDFNVDPTPAVIEFAVLPPVWKQGWFILLILSFLTILGIFEYRVISKKQKLEKLNQALQSTNKKIKDKGKKIEQQNQEILAQQEKILSQAKALESSNKDLEERNHEIAWQRDQLEEMVVQVEELSRAKVGFFTNISHELRTPLTLILGPVDQLQQAGDKLDTNERRRLYGIIERNASRLLKLINQLLEIRRIEQSALELNLYEIQLPEFIAGITQLFENLAIERDIYLGFSHHGKIKPAALDPDKLEKIVVNLLSNSFKHTPDGGSISVDLHVVNAGEYELPAVYDRYFQLTVEDTGSGISPEALPHIFERYFASEKDKNDPLSSGIGLAYIKDLLEVMQGTIRVESSPGKGATFYVFFPAVHLPAQKLKKADAEPLALALAKEEAHLLLNSYTSQFEPANGNGNGIAKKQNPRILIVEDNPDMVLFLESILHGQYRILKAENGRAGLAMAHSHSIDLIISDVMMPEMDGLEFCEKIKSDLLTSHIPVILLTAKNLDENRLSGYQKGANDYITKPFNPELLKIRVENQLNHRQQLREYFNREFLLTPKEIQFSSHDDELLNKVIRIMEDNLEEPEFNVNKMCELVHLSHMHFIRKIKQLTGKKPIDLLKSFRLKRAKDLLQQNKLTVSEIAYKVGYDLPNSFSRAFKKEFGISPTEFVTDGDTPAMSDN